MGRLLVLRADPACPAGRRAEATGGRPPRIAVRYPSCSAGWAPPRWWSCWRICA